MLPGVGPGVERALSDGGCALVVARSGAVDRVCRATLAAVPDPPTLLGVLVGGEPEAALAEWRADGVEPARTAVVVVGEAPGAALGPVPVDVVPELGDLGAIGRSVTARLERWAATEGWPVLCVDALGPLLAATEPAVTYRFLALLTRQVAAQPGSAVVGLAPDAVDAERRRTVETLFDVVLEREGETWAARAP